MMPIPNYGVLKCKPVSTFLERDDDSPHFQIHCRDAAGVNYRIAINVQSTVAPSELLYLAMEDFQSGFLETLPDLTGYAPLKGKAGLDYIRNHFFARDDFKKVPHNMAGPNNDLLEFLDCHIQHAIENDAWLYVFGSKFSGKGRDKVFRFSPINGMHNVHMNQGNGGQFRGDDGIWQDGALFIQYPDGRPVKAIFLAFQSQAWNTDNQGHAINGAGEVKHWNGTNASVF